MMFHWTCCREDGSVGLCGEDLTGGDDAYDIVVDPEDNEEAGVCVVCTDLIVVAGGIACPRYLDMLCTGRS